MGKILMFLREKLQDDPGTIHATGAQIGKESLVMALSHITGLS